MKIKILIIFISSFLGVFVLLKKNKEQSSPVLPTPTVQKYFLESIYKDITKYNESFSNLKNTQKYQVLAAITSHHFLARDLISATFNEIEPNKIKTVIIVSPDHFKQINDPYLAQITDAEWHTPFGIMSADNEIITNLYSDDQIFSDINSFRGEHGIYVLVPFVKKFFPDVKIIPIILRQKNNFFYYSDLGEKISKIVDLNQSLLIVSSDFTHKQTSQQAQKDDKKSIELLSGKKISDINSINNDCPQCTALLFGYLKNTNTKFTLISNQNSFDISKQNPNSVTSYVNAFYSINEINQ